MEIPNYWKSYCEAIRNALKKLSTREIVSDGLIVKYREVL